MKILIDNGHGSNTKGKRSPDGRLMEYAWTREVAAMVVAGLRVRGYDASLLVPEVEDVALKERVRRVNYWCGLLGSRNVVLVSVHNNAAGNGKWMNAKGWSCFASNGKSGYVSNGSVMLADCLYDEAKKSGRKMRQEYPNKSYWVKSLAMTRDTMCPAILTENYFMDNKDDCEWLLSEEGIDECVRLHVVGIDNYCKQMSR